jgi:hypothetical protein
MSSPDPIGAALDAARLAIESVMPAEQSVTCKINAQLTHNAIASLERGLAFLAFEKARQERIAAQRQARAEVDQALSKPAAPPATSAKRSK